MSVSKAELKNFKTAKKNISKRFDVEIIRKDDIVTIDNEYCFSFSDEMDKPMTSNDMEMEMSNFIITKEPMEMVSN